MGKGSIWTGALFILIGICIFFEIIYSEAPFLILIYPLVLIGLGIGLVVLNKEENKIEQRKDLK